MAEKPEESVRAETDRLLAVTVDTIAIGTDINPLEIVMFQRAVKSRTFFAHMKDRDVRVISPDASTKNNFAPVGYVGPCERGMTD